MMGYKPVPGPDRTDVEQRRSWISVVRRIKLTILRAVPKHRLTAKGRRHIEQEERVFGDAYVGTRSLAARWIGSIVDAAAMARAKDKDVINAFRTLPDETGHNHPKRFMAGGNVQLSSAFADFSKENPERAIDVLKALDPKTGTRAAGYALEAMSEETAPDLVLDVLHDVVARGFDNEDFRKSASQAIAKLIERKVRIDDKTIAILEKWLAQPITDEVASDDTGGGTVTDPAMESDPNERNEQDCTHRSMLWGHGGISTMPSGDCSVLEALIGVLVARSEVDRMYRTLDCISRSMQRPTGLGSGTGCPAAAGPRRGATKRGLSQATVRRGPGSGRVEGGHVHGHEFAPMEQRLC